MRKLAPILSLLFAAAAVRAAIPKAKPTAKGAVSHPKNRAKTKAKPAVARSGAAKPKAPVKASSRNSRNGKNSRRNAAWTPVQRVPAPERYGQIQRALAEKGYFRGQPDGKWGSDSVAALKRFQSDQNLTSDGKLNSLSLIALGLGPKRGSNVQSSAQPRPASADPAPGERP